MNELALFAGAGGGILGGKLLGWRTVCAVEKDEYCQRVLEQRIRDGHLPEFPIWDDVRTFDGRPWRGKVDIVTAGFPCQPFSCAGKGLAEQDDRNMWPDTIRIIREVGPEFAFLENVERLIRHDYFGEILGDLASAGFDARWQVVSASEIGAPHIRKRLWILAHSQHYRVSIRGGDADASEKAEQRIRVSGDDGKSLAVKTNEIPTDSDCVQGRQLREGKSKAVRIREDVSHSERCGQSIKGRTRQSSDKKADQEREANIVVDGGWWQTEPDVGRVAHGVASRVDRLRATGNGQVSGVAAVAFNLLYRQLMSEE